MLNTGDGKAILSRGALGWYGRSAWWLKDRIDRRFVRKYARPELRSTGMRKEMIPCGGCAAKLGADVLRRVLSRVQLPRAEGVVVGLEAADDAAVFAHPPGTLAVATVDAFSPFTDDLYVVGQVAATNAASDIYAMGAEATTALALVCLPTDDPHHEECGLEHFLRGALHQLERLGIALVGGHTITGEQALLGFAMHGWVHPDRVIRKAGARPGDALVLTKPLGTGVILAAARAGVAPAEWVEAALGSMVRSNGPAMRILLAHGMRACTDVTGFGLGGHLSEVLKASGVAARLRRDDIPSLPGARGPPRRPLAQLISPPECSEPGHTRPRRDRPGLGTLRRSPNIRRLTRCGAGGPGHCFAGRVGCRGRALLAHRRMHGGRAVLGAGLTGRAQNTEHRTSDSDRHPCRFP